MVSTDDPTDYGRKSITLNGSISELETIKEAGFLFWKTGEKDMAIEVPCENISTNINVSVDNLKTSEAYVYCLYVDNGINRMMGDTKSFQTPTVGSPLISALSRIDENSDLFKATIKDDGIDDTGTHIVAKGLCWNKNGRPTVFDNKLLVKEGILNIEAALPALEGSTDYYIRAFAQNDSSYLAYGPELKIQTQNHTPILGDLIVLDSIKNRFKCSITNEGGSPITERGFCWNTKNNPTIKDSTLVADKEFITTLPLLQESTLYYIRAYAKNEKGNMGYGAEFEYKTQAFAAPILGDIVLLDSIKNQFQASVISDEGSPIVERGFCWFTKNNPTIHDNYQKVDINFSITLPNLEPATIYYIRPYATNANGKSAYGKELKYLTKAKEVVDIIDISDPNFKKYLLDNFDTDYDNEISIQEGLAIHTIDVRTDNISSLKGIEAFTNLAYLICNGADHNTSEILGKLTSLDVSKNTNLISIECYNNQLTHLDVSKNTKLGYLMIAHNKFTEINIENNPLLKTFNCGINNIKSINLENNRLLAYLYVHNNPITSINVGHIGNLILLCIQGCQIDYLDVSKNSLLGNLMCDNNKLTQLDLKNNPRLTNLQCGYNNIETLDLSNQNELQRLQCQETSLYTLDISNNTKLIHLSSAPNPNLNTVWVWKGFDKANDKEFSIPSQAVYKEK